jgi:hypothetical protein
MTEVIALVIGVVLVAVCIYGAWAGRHVCSYKYTDVCRDCPLIGTYCETGVIE